MHLDTENMTQIRCQNCARLLCVQNGSIKQIRTSDKIEYNIQGQIQVTCKCGSTNRF